MHSMTGVTIRRGNSFHFLLETKSAELPIYCVRYTVHE